MLCDLQARRRNRVRLVLADLDRVFARCVNAGFEGRRLGTHGVQDLAGGFGDDLDDRIRHAVECLLGKVTVDLATVVGVLVDGDGPAGKLGFVAVGHFGEARPALEGDLARLFVEADQAVAVGALFLVLDILGIRVGEHGDGIAEAVFEVAGPRQGAVRNGIWARLFVERMPPATVDRIHERGAGEAKGTVAKVVDDLLARASFGEKWASQWLDVARYADSEGLGADRPWTAWPYRDWVIRALNADMPYNDFLIKQLAGDKLPNHTLDDLIATNFHRLTQQNEEGGTDNEEFRTMAVMDRVNTTWKGIQGITFECIQCHDHPYDPIKHEEYYRLLAFFDESDGTVRVEDATSGAEIARFGPGTGGFVRSTLRSLVHQRRINGIGRETPFELVEWNNGELTLRDSTTGGTVELASFGTDNRKVFADMLIKGN